MTHTHTDMLSLSVGEPGEWSLPTFQKPESGYSHKTSLPVVASCVFKPLYIYMSVDTKSRRQGALQCYGEMMVVIIQQGSQHTHMFSLRQGAL